MNSSIRQPNHDKDRHPDEWLDRLVDGELTPDEYRIAIRTLEQQPDGWKRCALAFLESQAWRSSLAALTGMESNKPPTEAVRPPIRRSVRPPVTGWWVAVAASALLAFLSGRWIGLPGDSSTVSGLSSVSSSASLNAAKAGRATPTIAGSRPSQRFVKSFWSGSPAVTPEIRNELLRMGVQVRQDHGYLPLRAADGRLVLVPYEDVQMAPANRRAF